MDTASIHAEITASLTRAELVEGYLEPSWYFGRSMLVFQGLPDPGPFEDIMDNEKMDKRKADLEAQANIIKYFHEDLDNLQSQINKLRGWLNTYYGKRVLADVEGLPKIES